MRKIRKRRLSPSRAAMTRNTVLLLAVAFLLITAHRAPAPIVEETPAPTPKSEPAATPNKAEEKPVHVSANSEHVRKTTKETQSANGTAIPKGAVHLVANNDSETRKIFTYFRFPAAVAPAGTTGLYRIEVSPDGTVAAVTILKSMGASQDVACMKAFVRWRAEPGPLRIVDVSRSITHFNRVISH